MYDWVEKEAVVINDDLSDPGLPAVERGMIRVQWVRLGEGLHGDYNPNNEDDIELLRFDVLELDNQGEWELQESYCTTMPVETPYNIQLAALYRIMDEIYDPARRGDSVRRTLEYLSHMDETWFQKKTTDA
jgi:hypothetical protein